jgi:hypothetical protein
MARAIILILGISCLAAGTLPSDEPTQSLEKQALATSVKAVVAGGWRDEMVILARRGLLVYTGPDALHQHLVIFSEGKPVFRWDLPGGLYVVDARRWLGRYGETGRWTYRYAYIVHAQGGGGIGCTVYAFADLGTDGSSQYKMALDTYTESLNAEAETAYELVDVDGDGNLEIITGAWRTEGAILPERQDTIWRWSEAEKKFVAWRVVPHSKRFSAEETASDSKRSDGEDQ